MATTRLGRSLLAGLIVLALGITSVLFIAVQSTARAVDPEIAPTTQQLQMSLHRVGLDAESLTAAQVSANDAADVVQNMIAYLVENPAPQLADQAYGEARAACLQLERLVRSGQSTEADRVACQAARAQATTAKAARDNAHAAMFTAATADLSATERSVLATMRSNEQWKLPPAYLTVDMTEAERLALRDALANERISLKREETPDTEAQQLLTNVRAMPTVAAALASLETNLGLVEGAWDAAVAPAP